MYAVLLTPSPWQLTVCRSVSTRRRALDHAAFRRDYPAPLIALDDLGQRIKTLRHGRSRGRPPVPVCMGSRKVS